MAKVAVKRLTLVALKRGRDALLGRLDKIEGVHIVRADEFDAQLHEMAQELDIKDDAQSLDERVVLVTSALDSMNRLVPEKKGMFSMKPEVAVSVVDATWDKEDELLGVCREVEGIESAYLELRSQRAKVLAAIEQLEPIADFPEKIANVAPTKSSDIFLATSPADQYPLLKAALVSVPFTEHQVIGETPLLRYLLVAAHKTSVGDVNETLRKFGATRLQLPEVLAPANSIEDRKAEIRGIDERKTQLDKRMTELAERRPELRLFADALSIARERMKASALFAATGETFVLTAWARTDRVEAIVRAVNETAPEAYIQWDEAVEGDKPPTVLKNNNFVTPFEVITNMFSPPSSSDPDPNAVMAPFFLMFFGIMYGDAAYGLILSAICLYASLKFKMRGMMGSIIKVMIPAGLSTVFFGIMFGSYFGESFIQPVLFSPMQDPMNMLILCYTLGALHIFTGMVVKAVVALKRGDWQTAVFDQFSWILLILGLVGWIGGGMIAPFVPQVCMYIVIACTAIIVLFAGREKGISVGRIVDGLGALYGISGYLSDILSYSRLFALGLSTSVIAMVFNVLAGLMAGSPIGMVFAVLVLLVGHTFNFLINVLGSYVHTCRLQYIEFFGKFYEGGGRAFNPLMRKTKYVNLIK